jgi:hypothetical protein
MSPNQFALETWCGWYNQTNDVSAAHPLAGSDLSHNATQIFIIGTRDPIDFVQTMRRSVQP